MSDIISRIKEKARKAGKTIVLPESGDERMLKAVPIILAEGLAKIILLGDKDTILADAKKAGADVSGAEIIPVAGTELAGSLAAKLFDLRKAKGMTGEQAVETLKTHMYFAAMLVKENLAHGYVAGAQCTTAATLKPALQIIKTRPGISIVSSYFMMVHPDTRWGADGVLFYADSGLVENPTAEELSEIAISSAKSFKSLVGAEPVVAMLSYSTYGSAKSELTEKVVEATRLLKQKVPELTADGELQVDAALVPEVGRSKAPGSPVAGKANVLIFPDLNSGNIAYKLTQRLAKAEAYGPVTQGLAGPVNDLSRGCSAEDIVGVVAITAVQAQNM